MVTAEIQSLVDAFEAGKKEECLLPTPVRISREASPALKNIWAVIAPRLAEGFTVTVLYNGIDISAGRPNPLDPYVRNIRIEEGKGGEFNLSNTAGWSRGLVSAAEAVKAVGRFQERYARRW